jgi:uncharacterized protein
MKILLVFHPTTFCNLGCTYCWAPDKDNAAKMPLSIFENALAQTLANPELTRLDILWLTGEPLVMGLDYYRSAVAIAKRIAPSGLVLRFVVQTNGTLLNGEWAQFFKEHEFTVGVSIDGPQRLHDSQRVSKTGRPTFESTIRGINHLVEHGVKGGALCVVSKRTLEVPPDELFFFFHDRKLSWSYLIEARIGENRQNESALSEQDMPQLKIYLARLIELWGKYPEDYIRDFDQLTRRLFGAPNANIDFDNHGCLDIINVVPNGDFFWGNPELMSASMHELRHLRFNIGASNLWGVRELDVFQEFQASTHRGIEICQSECPYFVGCQGGNPAHKFYQHGRFDVSEHLTCRLNDQVIAGLLMEKVEESL